MDQGYPIALAKGLLRTILTTENCNPWVETKAIMTVAKNNGLTKAVVREARKQLGIVTVTGPDGKQYWALPERIRLPGAGA